MKNIDGYAGHHAARIGPRITGKSKVRFTVWAPELNGLSVDLLGEDGRMTVPMKKNIWGYHEACVDGAGEGARYFYDLGSEGRFPDPASHFQPQGVHGPSQVVDHDSFQWEDSRWKGLPISDYLVYEIHVGTFTAEGTFDAIIPFLPYLNDLGITAIELMPVAQFPGTRNWGYDGVYPFAPQNSYGGPEGLKRLVNECHKSNLAVILDVVYNHLGPEGSYLGKFGPYFTDRYKTPWGDAINFDGPYSDEVRYYFVSNALHWVSEYHIDALRVDAIHGIFDFSAKHILLEMAETVHERAEHSGRNIYVVAESDLNDVRVINPREIGGYGLDAQWNDDFHHALHTLLTGENDGYYQDFGRIEMLAKAFREGFVYSGQYSPYRKRSHGNSSKGRPGRQFVVFSQNHDQVGNRALGDRLSQKESFEKLKLAAGVVIFSPFIPLLFMGEEYGETAPFLYFMDHTDEALTEAVRKGRKEEFAGFRWADVIPDPQAEETFLRSKLDRQLAGQERHKLLLGFYREAIRLRKEVSALCSLDNSEIEVGSFERELILHIEKRSGADRVLCLCNFAGSLVKISLAPTECRWTKILESSSEAWGGPGEAALSCMDSTEKEICLNPYSLVLYATNR